MPWYKYISYIKPCQNDGVLYDILFEPGVPTMYPGIYRCEGCGREIALALGDAMPDSHNNAPGSNHGPRWRLVAYADDTPADPMPYTSRHPTTM